MILKANMKLLDQIQITVTCNNNCVSSSHPSSPIQNDAMRARWTDSAHAKEVLFTTPEEPKFMNLKSLYMTHCPPHPPPPLLRNVKDICSLMCCNPLECKQPAPLLRFHFILKCKQILR